MQTYLRPLRRIGRLVAAKSKGLARRLAGRRRFGGRKKLLLAGLPCLLLLVGGGAYAAINLAAPAPAQHAALTPGINLASGEKGLVGWWKLAGNTTDSTPYADNGAPVGGVAPATDRTGVSNGAYSFDGTSGYISVNDADQLSPSSITVSAWIYPVSGGSGSYDIVSKNGNSEYRYRFNSGSRTITVFDRGATNSLSTTATIPFNQWSLVSFTGDSSGLKIYINGQLSRSGGSAYAPPNTAGKLFIGSYTTTSELFDGSIADVRIYNRALSADEMANIYNSYNSQVNLYQSAGSGGPVNLAAGLIGYWPFAGNARDATPYSNNGTVNGATLTTGHDGQANSAYMTGNTSSWIAVGSPGTYANLPAGFTYSLWLMYTGASSTQWPEIMGASNAHTYFGIRSSVYGQLIYFEYGTSPYTGSSYSNISGYSLPVGQWHMITVTYNGSALNFYVDGALKTGPVTAALNPTFGGLNFTAGTSGWVGSMDNPRVYNRALSAAEVQALYNSGN
ncbi:MAG TPA: LamG domain-containing protein [Candidatus Saccharimonadales bacterium]|nr:LamG domain-containing protein [Candidatus Saccharimonadales bacterium]